MTNTTQPSIRRAGPGDAVAVRDLTRAAYAKWVAVVGREPRPMTADYSAAVRDHLVDMLYLDAALVALIEMIPRPGYLLIENVAVAPDFQGRGFGRRLIAHAEALAASLGHDEIRLYTNKMFAANVALYRGLGYRVDREEVLAVGTVVHMSKTGLGRAARHPTTPPSPAAPPSG
jgi:ribosomal protein S18 acetylase RimI-like enzyme